MTDVLVVKDTATQIVSTPGAAPVVVGGAVQPQMVVASNMPGPPGVDGVGGGATYISEAMPQLAAEKETWFNPTTHSWRVFHDGTWQPLYADGGFF